MYTELQEKEVTCRKNHRCEWCDEAINKGDPAHYRSYIFEGDFLSGWMHPECWTAMLDTDLEYLTDGWSPGDFQRGVSGEAF